MTNIIAFDKILADRRNDHQKQPHNIISDWYNRETIDNNNNNDLITSGSKVTIEPKLTTTSDKLESTHIESDAIRS